MSHNIYATFENRDAAERAAAKMRRKGLAFRCTMLDSNEPGVSDFRAAHASLSLLFPYYPPQYSNDFANNIPSRNISKALFTSDTLGLPLYPGSSSSQVRIVVDDEHLEAAKSILRNCGAYDLH